MRNTRTNQGGSVLAFIVVGAALAIAVVGGVYLTHQRGEEAAKNTSGPQQTDKKPTMANQPTTTTVTPTPKPTPTSAPSSNSNKPSTPKQPQTGVSSNTGSQRMPATGYDASKEAEVSAVNNSTNLPMTGPVDTILRILAAAILTAAVIAYVQSKLAQTPATSR